MRRAPSPRRMRGAMRGEHGTLQPLPFRGRIPRPAAGRPPNPAPVGPASAAAPQASGRRRQPFSREAPAPRRAAPCCRTERWGARSGAGRGGLVGGGSSWETPCFRTEMREVGSQSVRGALWAVARSQVVPAPHRAAPCFRTERWALLRECEAREKHVVEPARSRSNESKRPLRSLIQSLPRPGFRTSILPSCFVAHSLLFSFGLKKKKAMPTT